VIFFHDLGFFDMEEIHRSIDLHTKGAKDNSALIYAMITFQEWYKMYIG
jgi:hypothetical protein